MNEESRLEGTYQTGLAILKVAFFVPLLVLTLATVMLSWTAAVTWAIVWTPLIAPVAALAWAAGRAFPDSVAPRKVLMHAVAWPFWPTHVTGATAEFLWKLIEWEA